MAILLYEKFMYLTHITLCPNIQLLSTRQHAYISQGVTKSVLEIRPGLARIGLLCYRDEPESKNTSYHVNLGNNQSFKNV